jgi:voltage-gated potassium channel Kch
MPALISDERLEFLGALFLRTNLHARGILFETFVAYPAEIFRAVTGRELPRAPLDDYLPLLSRQRAVAALVMRDKKALADDA